MYVMPVSDEKAILKTTTTTKRGTLIIISCQHNTGTFNYCRGVVRSEHQKD